MVTLCSFSQKKLPVINARSNNVTINDDGIVEKNGWFLSPDSKPDIYNVNRSLKNKWVTFYTDIDSIKVKVSPETVFDFIILLNGKDSCYTQIVGSKKRKYCPPQIPSTVDTIPFTLNNQDAIQLKCIINNKDTINVHFDLSTLDFRFTKETLLKFKPSGIQKLQVGKTCWSSPSVQMAANVSNSVNGRFGWRAIDDKIIEVNYVKQVMIVSSKLPKDLNSYVKSNIKFIQSLPCVEASIQIENKNYVGLFLIDTGSDLAMVLDSTWMLQTDFPKNQQILKRSTFSDGSGKIYQTTHVHIPQLSVNSFKIKNIPTAKLGYHGPVGWEVNYLGNKLLKRFNMIIDLKKDQIYLKPNTLFNLPF